MKDITQIQNEQNEWAKRNFPDSPAYHPLLGIGEEYGELLHAFLKREQGIREANNYEFMAKDAIGDMMIYLCHFCNLHGWNLNEIINGTWREVSERDWQKNKKNGLTE